MRVHQLFTFLLLGAVSLVACEKEDPVDSVESGELELSFETEVYDEDLELNSKTYSASTVEEGFRVNRFSFYLSDIELVQKVDGNVLTTQISDVAYVQVDNDGEAKLNIANIPAGTYSGIRFNIGLTEEQDKTKPSDYAAGNPLSKATEYWVDWESYIFMKIEGKSDTLADNNELFDSSFTYHIGKSAKLAKRVSRTLDFTIGAEKEELDVTISLSTLLGLDSSTPLSLRGVADHQNGLGKVIMGNADKAFTIAID